MEPPAIHRNPVFLRNRVSEWRVEFPTTNGLHRASLTATPNTDGTLALRAILEGQQQGRAWVNSTVPNLSAPVELTCDAEAGETPSAGPTSLGPKTESEQKAEAAAAAKKKQK